MSDLKRLAKLIERFVDADDGASIRYAEISEDERDFLLALDVFVRTRVDEEVHRHLMNYKHEDIDS